MIKEKIILYLIIFLFSNNSLFAEIKILAKVNNDVITNYDLKKESNYLEILNPNVSKLDNNQKLILAKNSLVKEIIKKKEIEKFTDIEKKDFLFDEYMENFYKRVGVNTKKEFQDILKLKINYSLEEIKNKIKIELIWNDLIYSKYINQVKIDEVEIMNKVDSLKDDLEKKYLLSEIVFRKKIDKTLNETFEEIKLSINQVGFANAANIYSYSDSSKFGGKIGWLSEISLPEQIRVKLKKLEIGEISDFIKIGNNFVILKIEDTKLNKKIIDREKEINSLKDKEINDQLNKFSKIFFEKIKLNYSINEN
ncbi:peptidylprolyl isomerase [Pelagibacterales bacterium SAG-MED43]|nr:peptidylprolyl isomerase [Pelagibacterales bacterium SAG-MED43]